MLLLAVAFPNDVLPFIEKNAWFHAAVMDEPSTRPESSPLSPPPSVAAQPEITSAPAAVSATAAEMRLILTDSSCAGLCAHVKTEPNGGADRETLSTRCGMFKPTRENVTEP